MDIRVLVASEVLLYREGLRRMLQDVAGIDLVGIATSAEEVVAGAINLMPAVVLIDFGIAESLALLQNFGGAPHINGLVIVGARGIDSATLAALPMGLLACLDSDGTESDLHDAICAAARGEARKQRVAAALHPPLVERHDQLADLTTRETEILRLMQRGLSNKLLSRRLGIELSTVKNHVHSILAKLSASSRGEAISLLYRHDQTTAQEDARLTTRAK